MAASPMVEIRVLDSEQGRDLARIRVLASLMLAQTDSKTPGYSELQHALWQYANKYEVIS